MRSDSFLQPVRVLVILFILLLYLLPVLSIFASGFMHNESLGHGIGTFEYVQNNLLSWQELSLRIDSIMKLENATDILIHSFILSLLVAITLGLISWVTAFFLTRKKGMLVKTFFICSLLTYLTPPVVLSTSLSLLWQEHSRYYILSKVFVAHCMFLYPLSLTLSFGFWSQKKFSLDRSAALDGAGFWQRMKVHFCSNDLFAIGIVSLLVFMVSWSDIIFSRIIASPDSSKRLVVDYIFENIQSNPVISDLGGMALFTSIIVCVSSIMAFFFAVLFSQRIVRH